MVTFCLQNSRMVENAFTLFKTEFETILEKSEEIIGLKSSIDALKIKKNYIHFRKKIGKQTGRNDLCYCGSGKKYKNCHWKEDIPHLTEHSEDI